MTLHISNKLGSRIDLKADLIKAYMIYDRNNFLERNDITKLFNIDKYFIGINPISRKKVFVYSKDLSYFIKKHGNEMTKEDLLSILDILNYWKVFKYQMKDELKGYIFINKSKNNEGYLESIVKNIDDGEELFHFQYMGKKNYKKKYKKIANFELTSSGSNYKM